MRGKCFYFLLCGCLVACSSISIAAEFNLDKKVERLVDNSEIPLKKKKQRLLDLLDQCEKPEQKGRIYAEITHLYFKKLDPKTHYEDKVIYYSQKAVEYPLDTLELIEVYRLWGDALLSIETKCRFTDLQKSKFKIKRKAGQDSESYNSVWSKPSGPYIKALDLVLQSLKNKPEWPVRVDMVNVPKSDPVYEKLMKKHDKQLARRKKAKEETRPLILKRGSFKTMIAQRYRGRQKALSKLRSDIYAVIDDKERAQKIYKLVKDELVERLRRE